MNKLLKNCQNIFEIESINYILFNLFKIENLNKIDRQELFLNFEKSNFLNKHIGVMNRNLTKKFRKELIVYILLVNSMIDNKEIDSNIFYLEDNNLLKNLIKKIINHINTTFFLSSFLNNLICSECSIIFKIDEIAPDIISKKICIHNILCKNCLQIKYNYNNIPDTFFELNNNQKEIINRLNNLFKLTDNLDIGFCLQGSKLFFYNKKTLGNLLIEKQLNKNFFIELKDLKIL
jgi:hypothetical protein